LPAYTPLAPIPVNLAGRTAIVTGATSGIGFETARGLGALGADVVMVGRTHAKAASARHALIREGVPAERLTTAEADLCRPQQVAALGRELADRYPRIDVLVNNAAIYPAERVITPEGFEECWATNVLAYEILTTVLQDPLRAAGGRLVNVSSRAPMAGGLDTQDLFYERRRWSGVAAYKQSKQAIRMLSWAWDRRLSPDGVTVNVAHPDGTSTNIAGRQRGLWGVLIRSIFRTQRSPAEGADTSIWLAASPAMDGRTAGFYVDRGELDCEYRDDIEGGEHLWKYVQEQIDPWVR
jgi:NAD(P)-dependent dehydrogenase (short-subunit alcohol dehydrogenase family)